MHPLSTILFLLGYALALPVAARMPQVVAQQHRLALTGHQVGVGIATVGWLVRGSIVIVVIHLAWLIGVRLWFSADPGRSGS